MEKRTIEINGKNVEVRELTFVETFNAETSNLINAKGYMPAMLKLSTTLTEEEINTLSKRDGQKLWKIYNELNEDFQESATEKVEEDKQ